MYDFPETGQGVCVVMRDPSPLIGPSLPAAFTRRYPPWLFPLHQDLIPRIVRVAGVCALSLGRVQPISQSSPISLKQPRAGFAAQRSSPGWPCRASNVRPFFLPPLFSNSPTQVSSSVTVPSERYIYHPPSRSTAPY